MSRLHVLEKPKGGHRYEVFKYGAEEYYLECVAAKAELPFLYGSEVVVVGKRFISYYAEGESCKKEIYMDKIVKVEGARKSLTITVKDDRNKYHFVTIGDMGGRMAEMIETILFYRMNAMGAEPGVITPFEYAGLKNSFM